MKFGEIYVKLNVRVDKELGEEEGIESVVKKPKKINSDTEMRQLMELHERTETCLALTRGYAFQEDRREGEALLCKRMLERGMSSLDIANATGLSEKQVLELINIAQKDRKVTEPAPKYKTRKPHQKI